MSIWSRKSIGLIGITRTIFRTQEQFRSFHLNSIIFNTEPGTGATPTPPLTERHIKQKLKASFPNATKIEIEDISGGCGAMFQIYVESPDFKGINTVKQHQLVNVALKDEIKTMHGLRINTAASKS